MRSYNHQLRKELLAAGARDAELKELMPIASRLSLLKSTAWSDRARVKPSSWIRIIKPVSIMASGLALGMFIIILSQAALPSSMLYPVQKFSDRAAASIYPQYRANIMMKRAQQVNELVARHAKTDQVLAILDDYTHEARIYSSTPHVNYSAFEYCKTNLKQALSVATPDVRKAISTSLQLLETT